MQRLAVILVLLSVVVSIPGRADEPVTLKYNRAQLEAHWRLRIQSFLDKGVVPLVDLESSLKPDQVDDYINDSTFRAMDKAGVALMLLDGNQAKKTRNSPDGYRWSYFLHELVNRYPDRFILAPNGGTNKNWLQENDSFIGQMEQQAASGDYPMMGEFDFRHYQSSHQCRTGRTDRDNDIPINGENGHRLFKLSEKTGLAFVIHLEPEDQPIAALEEMLKTYPRAKVIWAHFGQLRHPERQKQFTPENVRRWLGTYPNLYYDISTGGPGRRYQCNNNVLDVALWQSNNSGGQKDELKPEFKAIFSDFSERFVVGLDYGGGRPPLPEYIRDKSEVRRLILRDLPDEAKHNIGYRNAWKLLTGKPWQ